MEGGELAFLERADSIRPYKNHGHSSAVPLRENIEMDVTVIEHVKELPGEKLRGYMLAKDYTEKEAARDYRAVYGHDPVRGWKWMNYLYLQLPGTAVIGHSSAVPLQMD